jgi:hypothetical protein
MAHLKIKIWISSRRLPEFETMQRCNDSTRIRRWKSSKMLGSTSHCKALLQIAQLHHILEPCFSWQAQSAKLVASFWKYPVLGKARTEQAAKEIHAPRP